ncbi:MAG: MerR family transcriptional regulator [Anaerolineae bacterium]
MASYVYLDWRLRSKQVIKLAEITYRQLDYWVSTGLVQCIEPGHGTGTDRLFSILDVIAVRAAAGLRKDGASLQEIRKAVELLRSEWSISEPLHSGKLLVINGRVYYAASEAEVWDVIRGQAAIKRLITLDAGELARDTIQKVGVLIAA